MLAINAGGAALDWSGGSGTWSAGGSGWLDGGSAALWPADAATAGQTSAHIGDGGASLTVSGTVHVADVDLNGAAALRLSYSGASSVEVQGDVLGQGAVLFPSSGQVQRYSDAVLQRGLHFRGGVRQTVAVDLTGIGLQGAPVLGAWGEGTRVEFSGRLAVADDGGQTFVSLAPREGGVWVFTDTAEVDVILSGSMFTRQLWIHGDGTGAVEFEAGFIADRTENGTVARGLGSYRISNTTLVTRSTANLPTSFRPDGSGGLQINGHLVFENAPGSVWRIEEQPQTYNAGVWIQQDMAIETIEDLTHTGVTTFSSHSGSYWAANAFQTDADNVTVTKRGPADLILAAEAAFRPGSVLRVEDGRVRFLTNPAAGVQKSNAPSPAGPHLQLHTLWQAESAFEGPLAQLQAIDTHEGTVRIAGRVEVQSFAQNHQEFIGNNAPPARKLEPEAGTVVFELGAQDEVALHVSGNATLGGFLQIERSEGFNPEPGTVFDVLFHGTRTGQFAALNDFSDLGVVVEYLADRIRLTTTRYAGRTGVVVDEDFGSGTFSHPGWRLAGSPSQVGIFPVDGLPGVSNALMHKVDHGAFTWGIAFLDVPTFRIGPDEVLVQAMTTYSDVANSSSQYYKIEIAALHKDTHAPFGHNRSAELSRNYSTNAGDQFQIFPSLYNDDVSRVRNAHHSGGSTSANLRHLERSLLVFRPQGDGSSTRVEAFGEVAGDPDINIPHPLEHWDVLQISMPRQWKASGSILANGVDLADAAMGMTHVHVGVTHRTDANLDYLTDAADFIVWNSYRGASATHLQTGDFNNDRTTDMDDLAQLLEHIGSVHDATAVRNPLRHPMIGLPGGGTVATFRYNRTTGELTMTTDGSSVCAWLVPGPLPLSVNAPDGADWWHDYLGGSQQWLDTGLNGFTGEVVLATYPAGLDADAFAPVLVGFTDGGAATADVEVFTPSDEPQPGVFASWAQRWFGEDADDPALEATLWGRDADPTNSGINNGLRAAMGIGPQATAPLQEAGTVVEGEQAFLTMPVWVNRQLDAAAWQVEAAADLQSDGWQPVPADALELVAEDADSLQYTVKWPMPAASSGWFLRVRYELAP